MNGWIKIHRKMRQWQHYKNPSVRMVFEDLLLSANAEGDAVSSIYTLQRNTGLTKPTIIKAIKILKSSGEITHTVKDNIGIYHINNYCLYQGGKRQSGGKNILPHDNEGGKTILPQGVKQIDHSGKTILPHNKNNKNNKEVVVANAHARTHEDFIENALTDMAVERGCMAMRITPDEYRQLVTEVTNDWIFRNIPDNEWTLTHLLAQMRIKHNINNRDNGQHQFTGQPIDPRVKLDQDAAKAMAALAAEIGKPKEVPF